MRLPGMHSRTSARSFSVSSRFYRALHWLSASRSRARRSSWPSLFASFGLSRSFIHVRIAYGICVSALFLDLSELTLCHVSLFEAHFTYCSNKSFQKMASLHDMAYSLNFREDMLNNNAAPFIVRGKHLFEHILFPSAERIP